MLPNTLLTAASLALVHLATPTVACVPRGTPDFPEPIPGSDEAAPPETIGYFVNHFSLNVKNLTASLDFYYNVFGLRHLFTQPVSDHLEVAYMGHAQGGRNGTGYQTTDEINREKNNNAGLIEMIHLDIPDKDLPASSEKSNTFGHIGIVVPDVEATQKRLESLPSVNILKNYGDDTPSEGPIANANGFPQSAWAQIDDDEREIIEQSLSAINLRFIYVEDPDGNIIEIQPQD